MSGAQEPACATSAVATAWDIGKVKRDRLRNRPLAETWRTFRSGANLYGAAHEFADDLGATHKHIIDRGCHMTGRNSSSEPRETTVPLRAFHGSTSLLESYSFPCPYYFLLFEQFSLQLYASVLDWPCGSISPPPLGTNRLSTSCATGLCRPPLRRGRLPCVSGGIVIHCVPK